MKALVVIIVAISIVHPAFTQPEIEWQHLYGGEDDERFYAHVQTVQGGWAFTGEVLIGIHDHVYLVVTDDEEELVFDEIYGCEGVGWSGKDLVQTEDGGFLIGGDWDSNRQSDFGALRVDRDGELIWQRSYGNFWHDGCNAVLGIKEDEFLLAGYAYPQDGDRSDKDGYLVKIDGDGEVIWERTYGGAEGESFGDIIVVENGYALTGYTSSFGFGGKDFWLVRVDVDGEEVWSDTYGTDIDELACALIRTVEDGGFAIAGFNYTGWMQYQAVIVKTDVNGDQQWFHNYPNEILSTVLHDITQILDGGYIAAGCGMGDDVWVAYTMSADVGGNLNWERSDIVEPNLATFESVKLDEDNGVTIAGWADVEQDEVNRQGWFVKLTPANMPPEIISQTPSDYLWRVPRGGEQLFSVEAIDPELQELAFEWILEGESISDEDMIFLNFPELDTLALQVSISDGQWTVSTGWQIMVVPLITNWYPSDSLLTFEHNDDQYFRIEAGLPDDTTLTMSWTLQDEVICEIDSVSIVFDEVGEFEVRVDVQARDVEESRSWTIHVVPQSAPDSPETARSFHLYPPAPNPFNSTTSLEFYLPKSGQVDAVVYDVNGNKVTTLIDGHYSVGSHSCVLGSEDIATGLYFVQFTYDNRIYNRKAMLIK